MRTISLIAVATLMFTTTAYSGTDSDQHILLANEGGNGGNTIVRRVSPHQIESNIRYNYYMILPWLYKNERKIQELFKNTDIDYKKDIPLRLKNATVDFKSDTHCLTKKRVARAAYVYVPSDASFYGDDHPNNPSGKSICLSTYRLSKKLNQDNYVAQSLGLFLHEFLHNYSHDEELITKYQRSFLNDYNKLYADRFQQSIDVYGAIDNRKLGLTTGYEIEQKLEDSFYTVSSYKSFSSLNSELIKFMYELRQLESAYGKLAYSWPSDVIHFQLEAETRLAILRTYICSDDFYAQDIKLSQYCAQEYAKGFNGKTIVSTKEYYENIGNNHSNYGSDNLFVEKVEDWQNTRSGPRGRELKKVIEAFKKARAGAVSLYDFYSNLYSLD